MLGVGFRGQRCKSKSKSVALVLLLAEDLFYLIWTCKERNMAIILLSLINICSSF